jgi:tetratricopeptide (TPR) repeat protein
MVARLIRYIAGDDHRALSVTRSSLRTTFATGVLLLILAGCGGKQEREATYLERGKTQYAQGNFAKAALEFRNALQIDPMAIEGRYYLGLIAEQTGDLTTAFATFTTVIEQDPKFIPAQLKIGQYAILRDDRDKALEKADLIIALDNRNAEAHALRGAILLRQGQFEEAAQEATKAQSIEPPNATSISVLSGIKAAQGDLAGALKVLDVGIPQNPKDVGLKLIKLKILGDLNDAQGTEAILRDLITNSPTNNSYKVSLVRLLLSQNRQDDAEKVFRDSIARNPNDKDVKLLLVKFLLERRGLDAAEAELLTISNAAPDEIVYSLALSEVYVRDGKKDKAKGLLLDIAAKDNMKPNALRAKAALARLALSEGDQATAYSLLTDILSSDPENAEALLIRAETALKAKDVQAAIPDLRTILRSDPNSKEALLLLIKAYSDDGEEELAIIAYRNYLDVDPQNDAIRVEFAQRLMQAKKIEEAEKQIHQALLHSPKFVPALLLQIDQHIFHEHWADAIETANWTIHNAGDEIAGRTSLGKIYLARDKPEDAIIELQRVTEMAPGPSEARTMLVRALTDTGKADQAIHILIKDATADATDADAFILLGDVYFRLNRPDEAQEALAQSIRIKPDWDLPYLKLVSLNVKMDRRAKAAEAASAGLKAIPNHVQLLLNLGMIEDSGAQFDAASEAYEAVLRQQPRNVIAANNLAALIADAWPTDKARLEEARRLAESFRNNQDPFLLDTLGWVQYRLGNLDDAIEILERSVKARPELAQIRYHLGMAYRARGNRSKARYELELATANTTAYRGLDDAILALAKP